MDIIRNLAAAIFMQSTLDTSIYKIEDYTQVYGKIMHFNKNKTAFIHQWYPFVEGYSKEFITSIINEIDYQPTLALDPFGGSGTTSVELQDLGINCYSFEVSPFMHLLASVKLERNYLVDELQNDIIEVGTFLHGPLLPIRRFIKPPLAQTFLPSKKFKKWVFHPCVMDGILDIKYAINTKIVEEKYRKLFRVALASIILDVSNVYRNGKCLSYKKSWTIRKFTRREVHQKFLNKLCTLILPDIEKLAQVEAEVENKNYCIYGDVRKKLPLIPDGSIDLVITSPPYLNSRDYTDIYIAELWILDLINGYDELKNLRGNTFRSHVQVKHGEVDTLNIQALQEVLVQLEAKRSNFWNPELPNMIKGYFQDMDTLFACLKRKMMPNRKVFFNVANSAYYGIEIKVDEIICRIAEEHGFLIEEIREARQLKPSSQQKESIKSLRESVIVMRS